MIRSLTKFVNLENPNSAEAKVLVRGLRVKVIQRFKNKKPRRLEATFAPDGRIIGAQDGDYLRFIRNCFRTTSLTRSSTSASSRHVPFP